VSAQSALISIDIKKENKKKYIKRGVFFFWWGGRWTGKD
jgi:hypothetical protein